MRTRHLVLIALIMFLSGCSQGGACGCRSSMVEAPPECGGGPKADCEGNACADVKINYQGQGQGNEVKNNGTKKVNVEVQWFSGFGGCDSWSKMTLGPGQGQPSFFEGYCIPIRANYADPSAPTNPVLDTPKIVSFTITPSDVTAGASVDFRVVLSKPAPSGGTRVAFSSNTKTGVTSTMKDMPQHWDFKSGVKEFTAVVRTQRATNDTTKIIFTAFNALSSYSAELVDSSLNLTLTKAHVPLVGLSYVQLSGGSVLASFSGTWETGKAPKLIGSFKKFTAPIESGLLVLTGNYQLPISSGDIDASEIAFSSEKLPFLIGRINSISGQIVPGTSLEFPNGKTLSVGAPAIVKSVAQDPITLASNQTFPEGTFQLTVPFSTLSYDATPHVSLVNGTARALLIAKQAGVFVKCCVWKNSGGDSVSLLL